MALPVERVLRESFDNVPTPSQRMTPFSNSDVSTFRIFYSLQPRLVSLSILYSLVPCASLTETMVPPLSPLISILSSNSHPSLNSDGAACSGDTPVCALDTGELSLLLQGSFERSSNQPELTSDFILLGHFHSVFVYPCTYESCHCGFHA